MLGAEACQLLSTGSMFQLAVLTSINVYADHWCVKQWLLAVSRAAVIS